MPQISLYIDTDTDRRMRKAARAAGVSRSKWAADAIQRKLLDEWPAEFLELNGAWPDFPTADELREPLADDAPRADL